MLAGADRVVLVYDVTGYQAADNADPQDTVFALEISVEPHER